MATIAQNLATLQQARTDIAEAIENKGVTLEEGAGFTDFPQAIEDIPTGVDTSNDTVTPETLAEGVTAHDASGAQIVGTAGKIEKKRYGIRINEKDSNPTTSVIYIADAVGMTPVSMGSETFDYGSWQDAFFMPKPCMVKYDGTVDYYLDPNDYTKREDGTPSDVGNTEYEGNAMMEFPLIWYNFWRNGDYFYIYIANYKVNEFYKCYCNTDNYGQVSEHFYMSIYSCSVYDNKLRSLSGVYPDTFKQNSDKYYSRSYNEHRSLAYNNNSSWNYDIDLICDRQLIQMLLYLMGKSRDIVQVFGEKYYAKSTITGNYNKKGLFYGLGKIFGLENYLDDGVYPHDHQRLVAGLLIYQSSSYTQGFYYKMTYSKIDGSNGNGYNSISNFSRYTNTTPITDFTSYFGGYVYSMGGNDQIFLPYKTSNYATSSTYYCEYLQKDSSSGYEISLYMPTVRAVNFFSTTMGTGRIYTYLSDARSSAWNTRLSFKPNVY